MSLCDLPLSGLGLCQVFRGRGISVDEIQEVFHLSAGEKGHGRKNGEKTCVRILVPTRTGGNSSAKQSATWPQREFGRQQDSDKLTHQKQCDTDTSNDETGNPRYKGTTGLSMISTDRSERQPRLSAS